MYVCTVCMYQKKKISANKKLLPILNEMCDQLRINITSYNIMFSSTRPKPNHIPNPHQMKIKFEYVNNENIYNIQKILFVYLI